MLARNLRAQQTWSKVGVREVKLDLACVRPRLRSWVRPGIFVPGWKVIIRSGHPKMSDSDRDEEAMFVHVDKLLSLSPGKVGRRGDIRDWLNYYFIEPRLKVLGTNRGSCTRWNSLWTFIVQNKPIVNCCFFFLFAAIHDNNGSDKYDDEMMMLFWRCCLIRL